MNASRLITLGVLVVASVGLAVASRSESWGMTVSGAVLVVAAALVFFRHFWRESDRKRKQELANQAREISLAAGQIGDRSDRARVATEAGISDLGRRLDVFSRGILEYVAQLEIDVETLDKRLADRFRDVDRAALRHRNDILTQVSGVIGVYSVLRPRIPYPSFGGWAIGGDCAQRLVGLILTMKPDWVIEAGSGLSTLLVAQAFEMVGGNGHIVSLEHEKKWLEETETLLAKHGVSHRATVVHAPLVDTAIGEEVFPWYDLTGVALPEHAELVFIDGPPQATGPAARYPALPILYDRLAEGSVLLMDDAGRADEQTAIDRWREHFPELTFRFHSDSKGTVEIVKGPV